MTDAHPSNAASEPGTPGTIVIRTHHVDDGLLRRADLLARDARYEVVVAVDERHREWDTGPFAKLSLTDALFDRLGLHRKHPSYLWYFGDYVFYAARRLRPDAAFLWVVEHDVALNAEDPALLLRRIDAASTHDLLASHTGPTDGSWAWHWSMRAHHHEVHRCFFPVVRLSRRAIDYLYGLRSVQGQSYEALEREGRLVPNDEAFVATALAAVGFTIADLNAFGDLYTARTFEYDTLFNRYALPPPDGRLYHCVLSGDAFLAKLRRSPAPDPGLLVAAAVADPELSLDDCAADLMRAVAAEIAGTPDDDGLADRTSVTARIVSASRTAFLPNAIARHLVDAGRPGALDRLRSAWPDQIGDERLPYPNVALRRPSSQSSTGEWSRHQVPGLEARGANDGDRTVECGCHTDLQTDPWWQVDLGSPHAIHIVELLNRRHMAERLAGFRVQASPDAREWRTVHAEPASRSPRLDYAMTFEQPVVCRFLRVTVPGLAILHMVEFAAYGTTVPPEPRLRPAVREPTRGGARDDRT